MSKRFKKGLIISAVIFGIGLIFMSGCDNTYRF